MVSILRMFIAANACREVYLTKWSMDLICYLCVHQASGLDLWYPPFHWSFKLFRSVPPILCSKYVNDIFIIIYTYVRYACFRFLIYRSLWLKMIYWLREVCGSIFLCRYIQQCFDREDASQFTKFTIEGLHAWVMILLNKHKFESG